MPIIRAILTTDPEVFKTRLTEESDWNRAFFHVDVLDGSLFPEVSFFDPTGIDLASVRGIELHLMTNNPEDAIALWEKTERLRRAYIHAEMKGDVVAALQGLRQKEIEAGLAIDAATPFEQVTDLLPYADTLLIMGVPAGKGGQTFLGETILQKIIEAKSLFPHGPIIVDGGVTLENVSSIFEAGAASVCVNSAIYKAPDPLLAFQSFEQLALPKL